MVAHALADPGHVTWVARDDDGRIVGVVQLRPAQEATGRHRADVNKVLVHTQVRERGLGQRLMASLERAAAERGRWLLILETQTGSPAEHWYERRGRSRIGVLADHAAAPTARSHPPHSFTKALPHEADPAAIPSAHTDPTSS
ncbi:GNAT family N-acetyltransferase [Kribbella sp. NPDC051952]|uniref:GNAT family N-acetyltransferase n=1 Tax=Kribbella sp. NPDC051952 TaxID=3154851 RepID=UPI003417440D